MRLHENQQLFADAIEAAARPVQDGGLGIKSIFASGNQPNASHLSSPCLR